MLKLLGNPLSAVSYVALSVLQNAGIVGARKQFADLPEKVRCVAERLYTLLGAEFNLASCRN